jgi:hypothetical protein
MQSADGAWERAATVSEKHAQPRQANEHVAEHHGRDGERRLRWHAD